MPQNAFIPRTRDLLVSKKTTQRHSFFTHPPPPSPVIFATATVVAVVLLRNSRFNFHFYTQHEVTPTQKSARKWRCDLSRLLARKITKGIHSCKPASLNCPTGLAVQWYLIDFTKQCFGPVLITSHKWITNPGWGPPWYNRTGWLGVKHERTYLLDEVTRMHPHGITGFGGFRLSYHSGFQDFCHRSILHQIWIAVLITSSRT